MILKHHSIGRTMNALPCGLSALLTVFSLGVMAGDGPRVPVATATASANDGNVPANAIDGSLSTRWSASRDGQWLKLDLGLPASIGSVKIAWYKGDQRIALFDVQTSANGTTWTTVFSGVSSGSTTALESYDVTDSSAQYVRIVGHGNSDSLWNSISEVQVFAPETTTQPPVTPPPTNAAAVTVQSVTASGNDGNVPANTLDGSLSTRWSANGDGQWIAYKFNSSSLITTLNVAWYKGDGRISLFDVQTSANGTSWNTVFSGASSGTSAAFETYNVTDSTAQYLRIVGHGNSANLWNSITEVQFNGTNSGVVITNPPPTPPPTNAPPPTNTLPKIAKTYAKVQMGAKKMACYVNRPVDQYDPRVTRAVIVMHGAGANASAYFDRINNIIPSSMSDKVMVIAPYF